MKKKYFGTDGIRGTVNIGNINGEKFFKFNYENLNKSQTSFNLKERYDLIFDLFKVGKINDFSKKIKNIKENANLEIGSPWWPAMFVDSTELIE